MATHDNDAVLDANAFARAKDLFSTTQRLPSNAVEALASEVLARLSGRVVLTAAAPVVTCDDRESCIEALTRALISADDREATEILMQVRARGVPVEALYDLYLAGAACRLGQLWDDDQIASVEVVLAAGRIYAIMRGLRRMFAPARPRADSFRAVFASVPGETHVLGVAMAADILTLHGWEIDLRAGLDHDRLVAEIGQSSYPIIGLSASSGRMLFPLARLIVALRLSNPSAWIMVCGGIVQIEPDIASLVDADAATADLPSAETLMEDHMTAYRGEAHG
ncbi:MAG: B12-binding domain-containing protein [Gemmobacter sp.]